MSTRDVVRKEFSIVGDGAVKEVGLRAALIAEGLDYGVKVAARNVPEEQRVGVVVEGSEANIEAFWRVVGTKNLRAIKAGAYGVTKLEDYVGPEIDWTYSTTAVMLDQTVKGVGYMGSMDKRLGSMDEKLTSMDEKLTLVVRELTKLPEKIAKAIKEAIS